MSYFALLAMGPPPPIKNLSTLSWWMKAKAWQSTSGCKIHPPSAQAANDIFRRKAMALPPPIPTCTRIVLGVATAGDMPSFLKGQLNSPATRDASLVDFLELF